MNKKLLLVDDDREVLEINKSFFTGLGYTVELAYDGPSAMGLLRNFTPDCIILDVMMPEMDGFELCKWIKANSPAPVIFLTGRTSEDDKINGLLLGADDYMIKPYSLRELEVRIQVLIRRYSVTNSSNENILSFPPLSIDIVSHAAFYENERLSISNKELEFLTLLARSPQKIFTFEEIGNAVWGSYIESDRKTIMVTASRLRKKFESYPGLENCIETVWSKGYKFVL